MANYKIERRWIDRKSGREIVRIRYYDNAGAYNSSVDLYADTL